MKKLKYILPLLILFLAGCESDDDGFYNTVYVDAANLVEIEIAPSYELNDVIFINAEIPNLLFETNQLAPLDIRRTTGNAETFDFSYVIERNQNGEWVPVDLTSLHVADEGLFETGSFIRAFAKYSHVENSYLYRGGIKLTQAGNYRLSFGYNSTSTDKVELFSNSQGNNITVKISSATSQLNNEGFYMFTVN